MCIAYDSCVCVMYIDVDMQEPQLPPDVAEELRRIFAERNDDKQAGLAATSSGRGMAFLHIDI